MQKQESKKISRFFLFFILYVFCITGIYQSYELADSLFVYPNTAGSIIYERTLCNLSQDVYLEESSPLEQLTFLTKETYRCIYLLSNLSYFFDTAVDVFLNIFDSSFPNILRENCLKHFSSMIIIDYLHLTDGEK